MRTKNILRSLIIFSFFASFFGCGEKPSFYHSPQVTDSMHILEIVRDENGDTRLVTNIDISKTQGVRYKHFSPPKNKSIISLHKDNYSYRWEMPEKRGTKKPFLHSNEEYALKELLSFQAWTDTLILGLDPKIEDKEFVRTEKLNDTDVFHYRFKYVSSDSDYTTTDNIDVWIDRNRRTVKQTINNTSSLFVYNIPIPDTVFQIPNNIHFEDVKE